MVSRKKLLAGQLNCRTNDLQNKCFVNQMILGQMIVGQITYRLFLSLEHGGIQFLWDTNSLGKLLLFSKNLLKNVYKHIAYSWSV